jgi:hypothetical protein
MNPLDEALELLGIEEEELEKEGFAFKPQTPFSPREQRELQMWHDWNNSGRNPNKLRPLVHSLQPLVNNRLKIYEHQIRDIPPGAIRAEFQDQLLNSLETFDPNKGRMKTWVTGRFRKVNRFINTYQNPARIGEKRIKDITKFKTAVQTLQEQLGRSPSAMEIADHAKMPVADVSLLQTELRKAHPAGQVGEADPTTFKMSRTQEVLRLLPYDLTPEENAVFERVHGLHGHRPQGTGAIAKSLGMSAPKVSRLKSSIAGKWKQYDRG